MPIGSVLLKQHVADVMKPGDHGSTFAGNPLVCAAAVATFDVINTPEFLADVARKGEKLRADLRAALDGNAHVKEVWWGCKRVASSLLLAARLCAPDGC